MPRWLEFRNDSEFSVPAHGVVKITGIEEVSDGRLVLIAERSDSYGSQYSHALNSRAEVPAGAYGACTFETPAWAFFEGGEDPEVGQLWGPLPDSFALSKDVGGFQVVGGRGELEASIVQVVRAPLLRIVGKTDAAHNKGQFGTVSIYRGALGQEADTQHDLEDVYNRFADVEADRWVTAAWTGEGWELSAAEC